MKNKIIDLFCGCGGLSLGFEEAGFEPLLAIDMWDDAVKTYNYNRVNKVAECKDITLLTNNELKKINKNNDIVGIIGGPPCQGFSTVGKRDINDPRNKLYLEYCRIVECIKPKFFVLENVKGLLTLSNGMFKDDICKRFSNLGYKVNYQILNAKDYGVPQHRERVFFVGIKNVDFKFPNKKNTEALTCLDAISDLPALDNNKEHINVEYEYTKKPTNQYQFNMRKGSKMIFNHQQTIHTEQTIKIISMIPDGGGLKDISKKYWNVRKYNKAFERMSSKKPSNTVDTGHRNYFHYKENRIPTVRENARLQSFPDKFIFLGNRMSQYKQVGNAVPVILAKELAKAIAKQI